MQSNPPQYPGAPYYPMATENLLKKRYVLGLNAVALLALWLAGIIVILSGDLNARGFARFLAISGGLVGAFGSVAGSLGSKRTSDMQNLGLLVWAGLLLSFTIGVLGRRAPSARSSPCTNRCASSRGSRTGHRRPRTPPSRAEARPGRARGARRPSRTSGSGRSPACRSPRGWGAGTS